MKIIGLTGNIAVGKTTVSSILKELGAFIIDADQVAKCVVAKGKPAWREIREKFGEEYFFLNGDIDRKRLGKAVFSSPEHLSTLNSITHPYIKKEIEDKLNCLRECKGTGFVIVDAALLIEAGFTDLVDDIWLVIAREELQVKRLMERNHLSKEDAELRIKSQMPQEDKKKYASKIIDNSYSLRETRRLVVSLWNSLIN